MPTYQYQVLNPDGSLSNGQVFGTSMDAAVADLRNRGLEIQNIGVATSIADPLAPQVRPQATTTVETPTEIPSSDDVIEGRYAKTSMESDASKSVAQGVESYEGHSGRVEGPPTEQRSYVATSVIGPLVGKINLATLGFFFNQLGTMQKAGVPMVQSLDTLAKQSNDFRFRNVVEEMKGHVEAGRPMSAGMQRYPEVFTPVMLSIIRTGEEGGFLDEAMFTVAKYIEDEIELRNLYRRVTIYPKILVVVSILIILGANFVIGAVNAKATKLSSPLTTASTWFWLTPLLIGLFLFFRVGLANFRIKYLWDAFVSHIPFVGKTVRMMSMAKFGRAFGAMYHAGVPLPKVIQLSSDSCGNEYMRARLYPAGQRLEGGAGVTETLQATNALSPIVINMLSTGERTGNLDQMLGKMADYYHDEAKTRSVQLGHIVGVVVFLCVAIYIGYIIIQFYMGYGSQVMDFAK